jgi:hypothetical protein
VRVILGDGRVEAIEVSLGGIPPGPNQTRGEHWGSTAKTAAIWKSDTANILREATRRAQKAGNDPGFPWGAVDLQVTFRYTTAGRRDVGNMIAALKPVIDGLPAAGIMKDDSYLYLDDVRAIVQRRLHHMREIVILIRRCRHQGEQRDLFSPASLERSTNNA